MLATKFAIRASLARISMTVVQIQIRHVAISWPVVVRMETHAGEIFEYEVYTVFRFSHGRPTNQAFGAIHPAERGDVSFQSAQDGNPHALHKGH